MDARINLKIHCELKNSCYLHTLLILLKRSVQNSAQPLLACLNRHELLRKQHAALGLLEKIPLPKSLKREASLMLNKMFSEIRYVWLIERYAIGTLQEDFLQIPFWNIDGSLKRKKIAEIVLETPDLDVDPQYSFAGEFYLERSVRFWDQMENDEQRAISKMMSKEISLPACYFPVLPSIESLANLSRRVYTDINMESPGYFDEDVLPNRLKELNEEEKIKFLIFIASTEKIQPEKMRFCLSLLDKNQQKQVCINNPAGVLRCLLSWPYHRQFMTVALCLKKILSERDFYKFITNVINDIHKWPEPEHIIMLKELWNSIPNSHKDCVKITDTYTEMSNCFSKVSRVTQNFALYPVWGNTWDDFGMLGIWDFGMMTQ